MAEVYHDGDKQSWVDDSRNCPRWEEFHNLKSIVEIIRQAFDKLMARTNMTLLKSPSPEIRCGYRRLSVRTSLMQVLGLLRRKSDSGQQESDWFAVSV